MSEFVEFLRSIVYIFAAASFVYFLILLLKYWLPKRREMQDENFEENLKVARAYLAAAAETDIPFDLESMVAEALDNHESYLEKKSEIFDKAHERIFGLGNYMHSGHKRMAEFAKRHLRDISIVKEWDTERIMHYSRWACQRDYVILRIIKLMKTHPQAIFATEAGRSRSKRTAAKLKDFRSASGEIRKNFRKQADAVLDDSGLTQGDRRQQIRDLDNLAEEELRRLRRDMGLGDQMRPEMLTRDAENRFEMADAVHSIEKRAEAIKHARPELAEVIDEIVADFRSEY